MGLPYHSDSGCVSERVYIVGQVFINEFNFLKESFYMLKEKLNDIHNLFCIACFMKGICELNLRWNAGFHQQGGRRHTHGTAFYGCIRIIRQG